MTGACTIKNCNKPYEAIGFCRAHYRRWLRHGDPLAGGTGMGEALRYFNEVVMACEGDDCLQWPFAKCEHGYGKLRIGGVLHLVSRLVCERVHGPAPTPEHEAAHSCGKGHEACVSNGHLSWKTKAGNEADKVIHGTLIRGERHVGAKLTEPEVRQILALKGATLQREIADQFGISQQSVSDIHRKVAWGWLE